MPVPKIQKPSVRLAVYKQIGHAKTAQVNLHVPLLFLKHHGCTDGVNCVIFVCLILHLVSVVLVHHPYIDLPTLILSMQARPPPDHHLLPFIGQERHGVLYKLYRDLFQVMALIHNEKTEKSITELVQLAESW